MADVAPARPLPTVLQHTTQVSPHRSRRVSFSSVSDTISSDPHSGESWFQISASQSSQSSTSSHPPLPKGARPASPQPTRVLDHEARLDQFSPSLRRSGTFSSWKLEWRGISKVIKWAVLGDGSDDRSKPRKQRNATHAKDGTKRTPEHRREKSHPRLNKHLSQDRSVNFSPYLCDVPAYTSPRHSSMHVNFCYEEYLSHSELGHGLDVKMPIPVGQLPTQKSPYIANDRQANLSHASGREIHARELHDTNGQRAASEVGLSYPYAAALDAQDTFSDVDLSSISHESSRNWSQPRVAHSDTGHLYGSGAMHSVAFPSTLSVPYGHDSIDVRSGSNVRSIKSFRSAIVLPVSTASTDSAHAPNRRPRKLRKSLRVTRSREGRPSGKLSTSNQSAPMRPAPTGNPPPSTSSCRDVASAASALCKSNIRPPRKLRKKPSPALPPLPRTRSREVFDLPPPVPPKSSVRGNTRDNSSGSLSDFWTTTVSSESPLALTDTSASSSPDELHSSSDGACVVLHGSLQRQRPSLLRTESNRRWTVAVADVPDELIIEELERLRRLGLCAKDIHDVHNASESGHAVFGAPKSCEVSADVTASVRSDKRAEPMKTIDTILVQELGVEDELDWLHARRAIFCCRELVRTERSYQDRLQELADGSVSDAVPTLLIQYLPALIGTSKILSARFNEDMSAFGLCKAFVHVASTLESALVPWSGIVGEFFGGNRTLSNVSKRKRDGTFPGIITEEETHTEFGAIKVRCMSMHEQDKDYVARSSSAQVLSDYGMSTSSSSHWLFRPAFTQDKFDTSTEKEVMSGLRNSFRRREARIKGEKERRRKPPFRDLAILPTQRVTRYVLLYQDLLKHTPISSPIRAIAEKAVEIASQLAKKCDRAQDNSTFIFHGQS